MSDVFISYSRSNSDFVRRVVDELTRAKVSVWVDWQDIPISADWLKDIFQGIEDADNVVFFVSSASLTSPICHLELAHARKSHKHIIPIVYEEVDIEPSLASFASKPIDPIVYETLGNADVMRVASENYLAIKRHNWLMMTEEVDFSHQIKLLLEAIKVDLQFKRLNTRFLSRARVWEDKKRAAGYLLSRTEIREALTWLQEGEQQPEELQPTKLQRDYIIASKKYHRGQRGRLGVAAGLLLIVALTVGIASVFVFELFPDSPGPSEGLPRMNSNTFNIAIADFAILDEAGGELRPDSNGTALAAAVGSELKTRLPEDIRNLIAIEAGDLRTIVGKTEDEKREAARLLAQEMNADIVIYGVIDNTEFPVQYQMSFYTAQDVSDADELTGVNTFGVPVEIELPINSTEDDDDFSNSVLLYTNPTFIRQMEVLTNFMIGLALVEEGKYERALTWLERAREAASDCEQDDSDNSICEEGNAGDEVVYYWTAVAYLHLDAFDIICPINVPLQLPGSTDEPILYVEQGEQTTSFLCAQAFFLEALDVNPDYIRAKMGLANAYSDSAEYFVAGSRVVRCDLYQTAIEIYNEALVSLTLSNAFANIDLIRMKTYYNIGLAYTSIRYEAGSPNCEQDTSGIGTNATNALNRSVELYPALVEDYSEAHEIAAQAYYQLGLVQLIEGHTDDAESSFDEVIRIATNSEFLDEWQMIGYAAYHKRGLVKLAAEPENPQTVNSAINDFTTVIDAYPSLFKDSVIVHAAIFDRARAYERLEDDEHAVADYCTLLELDISRGLRGRVMSSIDETACL